MKSTGLRTAIFVLGDERFSRSFRQPWENEFPEDQDDHARPWKHKIISRVMENRGLVRVKLLAARRLLYLTYLGSGFHTQ